jgi:hypothetical protein
MPDAPKKSNIEKGTWMLLIGIALFFDLLKLIPILDEFVDMIAFATFWLIFKMHGETYSKNWMLGGFILGLIPIVNMLPECTATIVKLYFDAKARNALAKTPVIGKVTRVPLKVENKKAA